MNVKLIKKIPDSDAIINAYPLSPQGEARVAQDQQEIKDILSGKDSRLIVVVGPCSAWPAAAVLEYGRRLKILEDEVKDSLKLVLRVYIQKPRTAKGWTGPVNQPDPFSSPDVERGIAYARNLMVRVIEMGLPIADEAVFTHNARGFIELLSWVAIGARSTEDQEHRIFASAVGCPVGMKNPTSGDLSIGVNSVIAAQNSHIAVFNGYQVETPGNPYAHLVLRGGVEGSNYDGEHLKTAQLLLEKSGVVNPSVIIDASHDNCKINGSKDPLLQPNVLDNVMDTLEKNPSLRPLIKGFMMESFLKSGSQKVEQTTAETIDMDGLSITDPCVGWEETAHALRALRERHVLLQKNVANV